MPIFAMSCLANAFISRFNCNTKGFRRERDAAYKFRALLRQQNKSQCAMKFVTTLEFHDSVAVLFPRTNWAGHILCSAIYPIFIKQLVLHFHTVARIINTWKLQFIDLDRIFPLKEFWPSRVKNNQPFNCIQRAPVLVTCAQAGRKLNMWLKCHDIVSV